MLRIPSLLLFLTLTLLTALAAPTSPIIAKRQATRSGVVKRLQHPARRAEPSNLPPSPIDLLVRLRVPFDSEMVDKRGYYFSGTGLYAIPTAKATTVSDATIYRIVAGTGRFEAANDARYDLYSNTGAGEESFLPFVTKTEVFGPGLAYLSCSITGTTFRCADPGTGGRAFGVDASGALRLVPAASATKVYSVIAELV